MSGELRGLSEAAATVHHTTAKGLFPSVNVAVFLHILLAGEVLAADFACERLDSQMRHVYMSAEVELGSEVLGALGVVALERGNLIRDHL